MYNLSLSKTYNEPSYLTPIKRRSVTTNKSMIDCKFVIKYSYVEYTQRKYTQKPSMFYRVKITQGYYENICDLSKVFYYQAIRVFHGHIKINIEGTNALFFILKEKPQQIQGFFVP